MIRAKLFVFFVGLLATSSFLMALEEKKELSGEKVSSITTLLEVALRECGSYKKKEDRLLCLQRTKSIHRKKIDEVLSELRESGRIEKKEADKLQKEMNLVIEKVY